jgi:hypothetical protein
VFNHKDQITSKLFSFFDIFSNVPFDRLKLHADTSMFLTALFKTDFYFRSKMSRRPSTSTLSIFDDLSDSSLNDSSYLYQAKRKKTDQSAYTVSDEDDQSTNSNEYAGQIVDRCDICQNFTNKCFNIPNASLINAPEKKSRHFKIQINLRNYSNKIDRDILFDQIIKDNPGIQCIVSLEINEPKSTYRSTQIYKILLNTKFTSKTWSSQDMYIYIFHLLRSIVGEEQPFLDSNKPTDLELRPEIILEKTNTLKEGVRWATIDFDPRYTNCFDPNAFSESFRVERWARQNVNEPFSLKMQFITSKNTNKSHAELHKYLYEHKNKHHKKFEIKPCLLGPFNDWREPVRLWWNDWCINKYHPKKKQMLIIGEQSNTGKTMFVTQALFGGADPGNQIPSEAILIPERSGNPRSVSSFAWQRARPAFNSVIFCDEFEIGYYNTETLKLVLEGSSFNPQVKGGYTDNIQLQIPAIFISNTDIPDYDKSGKDMKPLKRRFTIVRIPKNTKSYKTTEHNPYIELYKQQKINDDLEKAKELETAENALLPNIEVEESIPSEQNQIIHVDQNNNIARDDAQIINDDLEKAKELETAEIALLPNIEVEESIPSEQNQIINVDQNNNIARDDAHIIQTNHIVECVSNNPIDQQFQGLVDSSQLYNIVNNSSNNDQTDECVGFDIAFLNDLNSCQTPDAIEITPPLLEQNKALNQNENKDLSQDNSAQVNNIEKIITSTEFRKENDVDITTTTNEECEIIAINDFVKKKDEIDKIVIETLNDMMERLEKELNF